MENKFKYIGNNSHRLVDNDPYFKKEIAYTKVINTLIEEDKGKFFYHLFKNRWDVSEQEEKAFLTAIQWLGTPVGESFLNKVKEEIENGK